MGIKIEKLELKNFRIHDFLELEFDNGTNLILGENGTGKTTVFLAIIFALFGTNSLTSYERGKRKENLVRKGSSSGYVLLQLNVDGEKYIIKRYVPSGDGFIEKQINGKFVKVATGSENVTKFVSEKIFGIKDVTRILNILYIRQRSLGSLILETGKKSFSEKLEEILNIKKFSEIHDYLKSALNILLERLTDVKHEIFVKEKNIKEILKGSSLEELERIVNEREEIVKNLEELKILKARKESLERFIDESLLYEAEKIENELENVKRSLNEINNQLEDLRRRIRYIQIIRRDFKDLLSKSLDELYKLKQKYEQYKDVNKEITYSRLSKLKELYTKIVENKEVDILKLRKEIEEMKNYLEELINKRGELYSKKKLTEEVLRIIEEYNEPKCPVCGSKMENTDKLIELKKLELEEIKREISKIENEIKKTRNSILESEKKLVDIEHLAKELTRIVGIEVVDLPEILPFVESEIKRLENEYEGVILYEKIVSAISYIKRKEFEDALKSLIEIRNNYERKLETLTKKLTKINEMKKKIKELEIINRRLQELDIKDINKAIEDLENKLREYPDIGRDAIESLKKEIKQLELLRKYKHELERYIEIINSIIRLLSVFKIKLRREIARRLTEYINYWFRKIYVYPDIREIKIRIVEGRTDYVYDLYVRRAIGEKEIESPLSEAGLSGGQIVTIDLALRFALVTFLTKKLSFILLDEPTESLDERIRRKLAEVLKEFRDVQIIVCTHDEIFKEALSGKGYFFRREGNKIIVNKLA